MMNYDKFSDIKVFFPRQVKLDLQKFFSLFLLHTHSLFLRCRLLHIQQIIPAIITHVNIATTYHYVSSGIFFLHGSYLLCIYIDAAIFTGSELFTCHLHSNLAWVVSLVWCSVYRKYLAVVTVRLPDVAGLNVQVGVVWFLPSCRSELLIFVTFSYYGRFLCIYIIDIIIQNK